MIKTIKKIILKMINMVGFDALVGFALDVWNGDGLVCVLQMHLASLWYLIGLKLFVYFVHYWFQFESNFSLNWLYFRCVDLILHDLIVCFLPIIEPNNIHYIVFCQYYFSLNLFQFLLESFTENFF